MPKEYLYHIKRQDIASLVDTSSRRVFVPSDKDVASQVDTSSRRVFVLSDKDVASALELADA